MEFKDKVKSRRLELGLTLEDVANRMGVSAPTIQRYESGEIQNMRRDKVKKLADALDISPAYLMGWDDSEKSEITTTNKPIIKTKLIPLVGTVACGNPIYAEENIQEYITVDAGDKVDFALHAKGDSMNNCKIDDGDIVYVRQQPIVNNGEIALVLVDDSATIKRFYDYGDKIVLRPDSTNPHHKEQIYDKNNYNVLVQGKIIFIKTFVN